MQFYLNHKFLIIYLKLRLVPCVYKNKAKNIRNKKHI